MLAVGRIPAVDEIAGTEFGAGDAGHDDAVGDLRCAGHGVAALHFGDVGFPELLAGLGIERDQLCVERAADDLAFIQRSAPVDDATADDARCLRRILDLGLPELFAGLGVDRDRGAVGRNIQHALIDQRLRFFGAVIVIAQIPGRNQMLDVFCIDFGQRAVALLPIIHAVIEYVAGVALG